MADLYSSLIGEAPSDKEKAAEVAAALRRRRSYGELGMLTGDKVLGRFGQGLVKQADDYATQLQDTRQHDIDDRQTKTYQDAQVGHMGQVLEESKRARNMADATARRGQDLSYEAALARAVAAQKKATTQKAPKFTVSDRRDLQEASSLVANTKELLSEFKPEFGATKVMGMNIPGGRALSNAVAAHGYGDKGMDAAQSWWAKSERLYTLFNRNKLFGATLTSNEMRAWEQANATKDMKPEQIQKFLGDIVDHAGKELAANVDFFSSGGYNPDQISAITQRSNEARTLPGQEPVAEEPQEGLSPEEASELEQLRAWQAHQGAR